MTRYSSFRQLSDVYPNRPGFKADGTNRHAANAMAGTARSLRGRVLAEIKSAVVPPTADEIADKLGASILSIRPRVSELRRMGSITVADSKGRNESGHAAQRWKIAPPAAFEREGRDHG